MTDLSDGPIFHLATQRQLAEARRTGSVAPPSLEAEGFIHCSTSVQLAGTIARHFPTADELALLRLDRAALGDALVWEEGRPGEVYPHVYRAISIDEVVEVVSWRRDQPLSTDADQPSSEDRSTSTGPG